MSHQKAYKDKKEEKRFDILEVTRCWGASEKTGMEQYRGYIVNNKICNTLRTYTKLVSKTKQQQYHQDQTLFI